VEIQNPKTRDESHIQASDKGLFLRGEVGIVQHRDRIQRLLRRFVLDVFREGLLLASGVVDRMAPGDIAVESGGYVLECARLRFAVHAEYGAAAVESRRKLLFAMPQRLNHSVRPFL